MQRLRNLFVRGQLTEYILIGMYSSVAILSLVVGLTAKTGTLFGRAVENAGYGRPELRAMLKQLVMASADFSAGASVLVIAVAIVYWGRRGKEAKGEALQSPVPPGPPFLF
jgi:Fe2+ transport system protein B